jgi:hypothetical protein
MRRFAWLPLVLLLAVPVAAWLAGYFRSAELEGRVVDLAGPIEGAHVRFRGAADLYHSDANGRFRLPPPRLPSSRIVAAQKGHLIRGWPAEHLPATLFLARVPAEDNPAYSWIEPGPQPTGANNCVHCHREIYKEWKASTHARAAVNRHFLNLYDGTAWDGRQGIGWDLRADNPDGAAVCSACHAPGLTSKDPGFDDLRQVRGVDRRGVHCDFCHKIAGAAVDERALTFGRFGYDLRRPAKGLLFFGPLDDAQRPGESFSYSPVYRQSRYCAACHEGVIFGVPVYTTYSEWLASPARRAGKPCQSCHMAPTGRMTNIAPGKGGIDRDPLALASHRFPGSGADMLRKCLAVSVHLARGPAGLQARVEVSAHDVGHRVPTGFIDRNLLLVVEAFDNQGTVLPAQSGPVLSGLAGKGLAGQSGRLYAKQLSEKGKGPIPFWRFHGKLRDTRLFPGRPDQSEYLFPGKAERVRVRLLYRRFWDEVAGAKGWPDNEITLLDLYRRGRGLIH